MKNTYKLSIVLVAIFLMSLLASRINLPSNPDESELRSMASLSQDSTALVIRGEYLVNSIGCADCHSPKRMGAQGPEIIPELHLSGFTQALSIPVPDLAVVEKGWVLFSPDLTTAVGPWGQSFAANITNHPTGIGNWPEENFLRAMRHGKFKGLEGSRILLPPMPWQVYRNMTDEDLRAIYYFLKTTRPVDNLVPPPKALAEVR